MLYNVKAGIIGLDNLGCAYANLLKKHVKNLNLIAACGRSQKELLFAKNDLSLEYVYSDEKALFENHDIDVIFIFSETHLTPHQTIQAIEKGKHVFLLSPIALNVEDAQAVFKCADSHPSQAVMAASNVRFIPLLKLVKTYIDNGSIGKLNHLTVDSTFINSLSKKLSKPSGSVFLDTALDEIDLCDWLFEDKFVKVNVKAMKETIICQAETESGSSVDLIMQTKIKKANSYLNIYGEKGQIIVSNTNHISFKLYKEDGTKSDVFLDDVHQFMFPEYLQLQYYTDLILSKDRSFLKVIHAVDMMKLALAFEKSKVLGQTIEL